MTAYIPSLGSSYAPPSSSTWRPHYLDTPMVDYPSMNPPAPRQRTNPFGAWRNRSMDAGRTYMAGAAPDPNHVFGVNAGDFGMKGEDYGTGKGYFGVAPGRFGGTGDTMNYVTNINAGGGNGGGAGGGGVGNIANQFQAQIDKANQANESRYRDILGGYQSRYERGLGMLAGLGQQEGRDINELYDNQASQQRQDLVGRGLGNSTVLDTMRMGNERERNADLGRLNDRVRQQAMSTDAGLSGDTMQFMERKQENGPNLQMLAMLAQGMGQAGYGAGGFGGGYGGYGGSGGGMGGGGVNFLPPSAFMPASMLGGGYMPRSSPSRDARQAASRAYWTAKNNGGGVDWPMQGEGPMASGYASSWLPSSYGVTPWEGTRPWDVGGE